VTARRKLPATDPHAAGALGEITTAAFAQQILGRSNARAGRDWLQRHGVPYRRDGKLNWVQLADVKRALEALPLHRVSADRSTIEAAEAAVATLKRRP
jgi:hypothetical protein